MNVFQRPQPQTCLRRVPAWSNVTLTLFLSFSSFPASAIPLEQTSTPRRFVDWCLNKAKLPSATRHTVDVLLEEVETQDCDQADRQLSNLTGLDLLYKQISDLKPLSSLTNLTLLDLGINQIVNLKPLSSLTNLTQLDLRGNQIADIKPLSSLTKLTGINFRDNQIADLKPLSSLTKLTELELSRNRIADIKPLSSLIQLTYLILFNNQISDIKPLFSLTKLTGLYLDPNQMANLKRLSSPTSLALLNVNNQTPANKTTSLLKPPLGRPTQISVVRASFLNGGLFTLVPTVFLQMPGRPGSIVSDVAPQLTKAKNYFKQHWNPPSSLTQDLEYNLILEGDGKIQRVEALTLESRNYIDRTGMPMIGKPFISSGENGRSVEIRVVLSSDGEVRVFKVPTFPE